MSKNIKIAYFPSNTIKEKVLTKNGTSLDKWCTSAITEEDLNGNYTLDCSFLVDNNLHFFYEEAILKVKLDYGYEVFRVTKVNKTTRYIDIVARQITIQESLNIWLDDVRPENQNGLGALQWLLDKAEDNTEMLVNSDIQKTNTAYYENMMLYDAIHTADNSFINKWGGEVRRRQYTLNIVNKIGNDNGVCIREGKNLTGFEARTDLDSLVTRAKGKGFNGIQGNYVYSPLANKYSRVYTRVFEYQNIRVKGTETSEEEEGCEYYSTEEQAINRLDELAYKEFIENKVDELRATYSINFVELEKTEQYKDYVQAERVSLGDVLRVYIETLDTDINVRVVTKRFNILTQRTEELELSNVNNREVITINSVITELEEIYKNTNDNSLAGYIDTMMKAGLQDSYVLVRDGELLAMDTKDINTATTVTRLNKNGLGFSSSGYYGTYTYGFTLDGKINANMISTGILSAIMIKSQNGNCSMNLETGEVYFDKGRIGSGNTYMDLTNGKFVSTFEREGKIYNLDISKGNIKSEHYLSLDAIKGISMDSEYFSFSRVLNRGTDSITTTGAISIWEDNIAIWSGDGGTKIIGDLEVTGSLNVNGTSIASLENYMLESEGII